MSLPSTSLLARFRRHRGLWTLAVAVLLIKFVAGTVCLADGPRAISVADVQTGSQSTIVAQAAGDVSDPGDCVLGEKTCHCDCAHSVSLPTSHAPLLGSIPGDLQYAPAVPALAPAISGSLLRPPIA